MIAKPHWKPFLVVLAVVGAMVFVEAAPVYACSCVPPNAAEMVAANDGAFVGTYLGRTEPPPAPVMYLGTPVVNHFSVEQAIKGDLSGNVDVSSSRDGASCGLGLAVGQRTGLVLQRTGDGWTSNLCLQLDPGSLQALVTAPPPPPPPPAPPPVSPPRPPAPAPPPAMTSPSAASTPPATESAAPETPTPSPSASDVIDLAADESPGSPLLPAMLIVGLLAAGVAIALRLRGRRGPE